MAWNLFVLNLTFGWKIILQIENELNVIYFSNVAWKLVHVAFGSYVHSLLQISDFSKLLWAIYEFPWFYLIYFWFLILTHSYESLDGVHASFEIFGILFEQWSKFKVEIVKVGKILGYMKFGSADGPRVRGGRSAIHEVFHQRLWSAENCSADSPPMDRGRSARCTGKLRLHRWYAHYASADGPPSIPRTVRLRQVESAQKSDKYWINLESLKLKGPQVDHLYKWLRNLGLVLK